VAARGLSHAMVGDGKRADTCPCAPGAKQLTLDGVFHSPIGAKVGRSWYGSEDVIDSWVHEIWRDADELAGEEHEYSISQFSPLDASAAEAPLTSKNTANLRPCVILVDC
jgi:hypothetical protein